MAPPGSRSRTRPRDRRPIHEHGCPADEQEPGRKRISLTAALGKEIQREPILAGVLVALEERLQAHEEIANMAQSVGV